MNALLKTIPLALLLTAALAGCLAPDDDLLDEPSAPEAPMNRPVTQTQSEEFTGTLPAGNPLLFDQNSGCSVLFEGIEDVHYALHTFTPESTPGLAAITLAFSHAGPDVPTGIFDVPDMDLLVIGPEGEYIADLTGNACGGATTANPEIFTAMLTKPGEYKLMVVNFLAVNAEYTLTVEVEYGFMAMEVVVAA